MVGWCEREQNLLRIPPGCRRGKQGGEADQSKIFDDPAICGILTIELVLLRAVYLSWLAREAVELLGLSGIDGNGDLELARRVEQVAGFCEPLVQVSG